MRLSIQLSLNPPLPIDYRRIFMSYIKHCIERDSKDLLVQLYGQQENKSKVNKPFTFSVFFPEMKYSNTPSDKQSNRVEYLDCGKKAILNFSTNNPTILMHLYNGAIKKRKYLYKNTLELTFKDAHLHPLKHITTESAVFKTLSPILINKKGENEDDNLLYLEYNEQHPTDFEEALKFNLKELCKKFLRKNYVINLKIEKSNKMVVTHYQQYMTANKMKLEISAPADALQLFYDIGIGVRRSQGFGMLEIMK